MSELKPCPFCGTSVVGIEYDGLYRWVECGNMDCNAAGKVFAFLTDVGNADHIVANNWNTRPIEDGLRAELARLTAELAETREQFEVTDDLLNQATVTIGAVIACCTYNSNEDAKIGIYGISPDAFTRIDQFITNYNRAVSAGKVSVDVKPVTRDLSDAEIEELGAQEAESRGD